MAIYPDIPWQVVMEQLFQTSFSLSTSVMEFLFATVVLIVGVGSHQLYRTFS
jgi:TRAP-type C4-dicarboxylate transport system permease small subunit